MLTGHAAATCDTTHLMRKRLIVTDSAQIPLYSRSSTHPVMSIRHLQDRLSVRDVVVDSGHRNNRPYSVMMRGLGSHDDLKLRLDALGYLRFCRASVLTTSAGLANPGPTESTPLLATCINIVAEPGQRVVVTFQESDNHQELHTSSEPASAPISPALPLITVGCQASSNSTDRTITSTISRYGTARSISLILKLTLGGLSTIRRGTDSDRVEDDRF
jgi:hypothetical protein